MSSHNRCRRLRLALLGAAILGVSRGEEARSQWIEQPGSGWADLTVYHLDTRKDFEFNGDVQGFFADGHAISTSVFVTLAAGIPCTREGV